MLSKCLYAAVAAVGLLAGVGTAAASPAHSAHAARSVAARAATTAISNGSFETPIARPILSFGAGQAIGQWQVESGTVDLLGKGFWQAAEGDQSVDLNGYTAGVLSQTFMTEPGTKYTVTYSLSGDPAGPPTVKTGKVLIDGQNVQDFSFDVTGKTFTDMGWVPRQFTFTASGTATKLTFTSTVPDSWGPVIDDVKVKDCSCGGCSSNSCG
ncbi:choice-of-anchor C family protein [Streptomyces mirabilis]|uniref:choice-of-anchor C family protein n=1 Tax=Streptomyces mirabilis TaxID=68239 RepID=UPI00333336F7